MHIWRAAICRVQPTFADFVEIRKLQMESEGLLFENLSAPYESNVELGAR
jgi:hypothetical protein